MDLIFTVARSFKSYSNASSYFNTI